jgi:hypothetical protein
VPVPNTQARAKFKHTAFVALNRDVLLPTFYAPSEEEGDIEAQYWRGFRLVGIDGSDLVLPNTPELLATFDGRSFKIANRHRLGKYITGKRVGALAVVSYDLLNNLAIDARLQACCYDEKFHQALLGNTQVQFRQYAQKYIPLQIGADGVISSD